MAKNAASAYALGLLCTGTSLAIYGQIITNAKASHPSTHIIAWTKYFVNAIISTVVALLPGNHAKGMQAFSKGKSAQTNKQKTLREYLQDPAALNSELYALGIGVLDVLAYGSNCLGFPLCGSALSMVVFAASGQIFTAICRVGLLGKGMTSRQQLAVAVVTLGLIIRAAPWQLLALRHQTKPGNAPVSPDGGVALGVAYLVASAALYSLLGVLYEKLFSNPSNQLTHAQVNQRMSLVGLIAFSLYQLVFTWPRRQALLLDPMQATGMTALGLTALHAGFGGLFTVHSYAQGRVLESSGAMALGIVGALRAATVTAASAVLFCTPDAPHQCINMARAVSAVTITAGALVWATAPSTKQPAAKSTTGAVVTPVGASSSIIQSPLRKTLSGQAGKVSSTGAESSAAVTAVKRADSKLD